MDTIQMIWSNINEYISILLFIISVITSLIALYNKIKANFTGAITEFIKIAEEDTNLKPLEKMDMVVCWVKQLIPNIFKVVFNDKTLRQISQNIYDNMKEYKNTYVKNKTGLTTKQLINTINELKDDPESPIHEQIAENINNTAKESVANITNQLDETLDKAQDNLKKATETTTKDIKDIIDKINNVKNSGD